MDIRANSCVLLVFRHIGSLRCDRGLSLPIVAVNYPSWRILPKCRRRGIPRIHISIGYYQNDCILSSVGSHIRSMSSVATT